MDLRPISTSGDPDAIIDPLCAVFRRHLKSLGQKYTPERAQVLDVLVEMDDIFQADRLFEEMKGRGYRVSKATMYRTIKLLQDAGIIQQVLLTSETAHYQLAYGRKSHDLLVRIDTGEIVSIAVPELAAIRERVCKQHGLSATGHRFHIFAVAPPGR